MLSLLVWNEAVKKSAKKTMIEEVENTGRDWTKVDYDYKKFVRGLEKDNVKLPSVDINSQHTAVRELKEETGLETDTKNLSLLIYEYIKNTSQDKKLGIPEAFKNSMTSENCNIKFYHYKSEAHGDFYIMHVPNWADRGTMPKFSQLEQKILGYDLEYGNKNRFYHCSAGVGCSVAMIMMLKQY